MFGRGAIIMVERVRDDRAGSTYELVVRACMAQPPRARHACAITPTTVTAVTFAQVGRVVPWQPGLF